jgi:uncharacterized membrane protein
LTVVRFLHVLALAFFLGGQLLLVAAVVPVLRRQPDRTAMRAVARRFGFGSLIALAVLVATGMAMADRFGSWSDSLLQIKIMVVVLIGVLIALHLAAPESRAVAVGVLGATLLTVWLGVALSH